VFRNYLTIALRNIAKHKLYSFINIAGLALGLACVIFVILFIRYETSYDQWLPNSSRLYRLETTTHVPGGQPAIDSVAVPFPVPAAIKEEIPEVTAATRLRLETMTMTVGNRQFLQGVDVVDSNFLQVVRLPLVSGDPATVLAQPESLVLSENTARKFFGDANPLGQTITVAKAKCDGAEVTACKGATIALKVTGVLRNLPSNSQLVADAVMPNDSVADQESLAQKEDWVSPRYFGFLVLAPSAVPQAVIEKLAPILDRGTGPKLRNLNVSGRGSQIFEMHLVPFADVHLSSAGFHDNNMTPAGSWITVYGFAAIGLLILLIACFNFMNLATARAMLRAREIALRKCVGAGRRQLIIQFLGESVLMTLCALALALAIVEILLPSYDAILQRPIAFHYLGDWPLSLTILSVAIAAGLISGSYPALVLSGFRPATTLRTNNSGQPGTGRLRVILVVLQFAVSIGLGIAAIVVFRQISFARNIDLGFHQSDIVALSAWELTPSSRESLAQALRSHPGVVATALSSGVPFMGYNALGVVQVPGQPEVISVNKIMTSPEFPRLYDIPLIAGRLFSKSRATDTLSDDSALPAPALANEGHNVLIDVAAAARFGYTPRQAVGKTIIYNGNHVNVVGVVGNVKMEGAREPIKPTVYFNDQGGTWMISVRLNGQDIPGALSFIDKTYRTFAPAAFLSRYFLSDSAGTLYQSDEKQGLMFTICVAVAILIACLGLFGIAAFTTQRRTREIGIRKVFGARTRDIVRLLLWQFSIPVLIANFIAWLVAYYYLHQWLETFAYRISLNPLYFLTAGIAALAIAWFTVLAHSLTVARARPILALRHE
jgi:putative ABC transport system permease protein